MPWGEADLLAQSFHSRIAAKQGEFGLGRPSRDCAFSSFAKLASCQMNSRTGSKHQFGTVIEIKPVRRIRTCSRRTTW